MLRYKFIQWLAIVAGLSVTVSVQAQIKPCTITIIQGQIDQDTLLADVDLLEKVFRYQILPENETYKTPLIEKLAKGQFAVNMQWAKQKYSTPNRLRTDKERSLIVVFLDETDCKYRHIGIIWYYE